jgi:hypothetical protein
VAITGFSNDLTLGNVVDDLMRFLESRKEVSFTGGVIGSLLRTPASTVGGHIFPFS